MSTLRPQAYWNALRTVYQNVRRTLNIFAREEVLDLKWKSSTDGKSSRTSRSSRTSGPLVSVILRWKR